MIAGVLLNERFSEGWPQQIKKKGKCSFNFVLWLLEYILTTVMTRILVVDKSTDHAMLTTFDLSFTTILKITKEIFVKIC